ncbi:hypothetical protein N7517_003713 [Penicillium concentricum]|uniref:BZIP domain-containing protein n=1 Tax=Penicillium concentricum TaxID=293559 RepID=A0A9W9S470_9EURO|nr:uncharacterized protein N7517_003713 [Penicillium concentricum]KAJ5371707.1 hypothetical protein N7517_003713 [Penicillium concentricum]
MDGNVQFMADTAERRRTQNRLAQRKFREKRRRVANNAVLETPQDASGTFRAPLQSTPTANNNGDFPMESLPLFASALTRPGGAFPPSETSIASTQPGPVEHFNLDAIDQFLYQTNNDFSFLLSDPMPVQPSLTGTNSTQSKSPDPASPRTPSNSAENDHARLLSRHGDSPRPMLYRRTSDSDIRPESPGPQLPKSHNDDTVLELITSARSDKGWIGTLHIAAQKGHERIVRVLLLRGNMDANKQDSDGRTPLIHAIIENHDSVVRLLLSHGARIGVYDCDGRSALHWAVLYRRFGILQQLLEHRAKYECSLDLDAYDNAGWTPLHMSVDRAFEAGILMLLQEGADIDAKAQKCPYTGMIVPLMDGQR